MRITAFLKPLNRSCRRCIGATIECPSDFVIPPRLDLDVRVLDNKVAIEQLNPLFESKLSVQDERADDSRCLIAVFTKQFRQRQVLLRNGNAVIDYAMRNGVQASKDRRMGGRRYGHGRIGQIKESPLFGKSAQARCRIAPIAIYRAMICPQSIG